MPYKIKKRKPKPAPKRVYPTYTREELRAQVWLHEPDRVKRWTLTPGPLDLGKFLKKGDKLYDLYPDSTPRHVRGFVDNCAIVAYWRPRKQCWEMEVIYPMHWEYGSVGLTRRDKRFPNGY